MACLDATTLLAIFKTLVYWIFFCLGIFQLYNGEVWQKYGLQRTNYAEFGEDVSELPTILTFIQKDLKSTKPWKGIKYGIDFNISFSPPGSRLWINLTQGENSFHDSQLKVLFEIQQEQQLHDRDREHFKITPFNLLPGIPVGGGKWPRPVMFKYIFEKSSDYKNLVWRVSVDFTAENNSWCGAGYRDGEDTNEFGQVGWYYDLKITPMKYIFQSINEKCREIPYNELLFQKLKNEFAKGKCACRPPNEWLCKYMKAIEHIPVCQTNEEEDCYKKMMDSAMKDIPEKPCIQLEYPYKSTQLSPERNENELCFGMDFPSPPMVKVKEEYLIFDTVTLISSIGGIMGLWIGFSFKDAFGSLVLFTGFAITKLKRYISDHGIRHDRTHETPSTIDDVV